jgi:hypothetical protein
LHCSHIFVKACNKGHFGNNCNETCDGCISELCNSYDGVCDIEDMCKAGWYGLKCDKGKCIKLYGVFFYFFFFFIFIHTFPTFSTIFK